MSTRAEGHETGRNQSRKPVIQEELILGSLEMARLQSSLILDSTRGRKGPGRNKATNHLGTRER